MKNDLKQQIAGSFSRYSTSYDQYAKLQKLSARYLSKNIAECKELIPEGTVLEIGCGSGMLSELLASIFVGKREMLYMDIAPGMLVKCQKRLEESGFNLRNIHFVEMDAEAISAQEEYAFIVSGLTFQWFRNLEKTVANLVEALVPGGRLVFSFLGDGSFPEWLAQCEKNRVAFTLNPLPGPDIILDSMQEKVTEINHYQKEIELSYQNVKAFFLSLKKTGAGVNILGESLSPAKLRRLIVNWENSCPSGIKLTCKVNYFSILK